MSVVRGVVLDVNETLFSLDALDPTFHGHGLGRAERDLWFARTLRDGFALTLTGRYEPFGSVARQAFATLVPESTGDDLMEAFTRLEPHPDVRSGLELIAERGIPVVTLSVGDHRNVENLFARAGLNDLVREHLSCSMVQAWKPAPAPYRLACETLELPVESVLMIAAHSWDLAGARAVGMRTGWIDRIEKRPQELFGMWDVQAATLPAVTEQLPSLR